MGQHMMVWITVKSSINDKIWVILVQCNLRFKTPAMRDHFPFKTTFSGTDSFYSIMSLCWETTVFKTTCHLRPLLKSQPLVFLLKFTCDERPPITNYKKFLNFMDAGESGLCRLLFIYFFTFHLTINVTLLIILV